MYLLRITENKFSYWMGCKTHLGKSVGIFNLTTDNTVGMPYQSHFPRADNVVEDTMEIKLHYRCVGR